MISAHLGRISAVGGAVLGSTLVYIFPAAMFIKRSRASAAEGKSPKGSARAEVLLNAAVIAAGVFFAAVGTIMTLRK